MKSKEEFVRRFRAHIAGLALFGMVSTVRESTMSQAARALDIPAETDRLLAAMYDYIVGDSTEIKKSENSLVNFNGRL